MDKGKEDHIISPLNPGEFMQSSESILSKGYGTIDSEKLMERTRAPRVLPREGYGASYFRSSDSPLYDKK